MTKAGIASYAAFEETTPLITILRKTLFLKFSAIFSTGSGIQGGVEQVTSPVPHRPDLGVQVPLLVLQEVPGLIDERAVGSPGHSVHIVLHFLPASKVTASNAGVLVKAASNKLSETKYSNYWNTHLFYILDVQKAVCIFLLKHRKNYERCPGHSNFKFLNLSGIANCVTQERVQFS